MAVGEAGFEVGRADGSRGVDSAFDVPRAVGGLVGEEPLDAELELVMVGLPEAGGAECVSGLGGGVGVRLLREGRLGPRSIGALESGEVGGGGLDELGRSGGPVETEEAEGGPFGVLGVGGGEVLWGVG